MRIIPHQNTSIGETVQFEGKTYIAKNLYPQGTDMKAAGYTHMMYDGEGYVGMAVEAA